MSALPRLCRQPRQSPGQTARRPPPLPIFAALPAAIRQLRRRQSVSPRDMADLHTVLATLRDNRRLLIGRPRAPTAGASEDLNALRRASAFDTCLCSEIDMCRSSKTPRLSSRSSSSERCPRHSAYDGTQVTSDRCSQMSEIWCPSPARALDARIELPTDRV
jgi:hypothetical protein